MQITSPTAIDTLIKGNRNYFKARKSIPLTHRLLHLKQLQHALQKHEQALFDALWQDLHKSKEEAYLTEIGLVKQELKLAIRHLKRWARPNRKRTPLHLLPSWSKITYQPLGHVLIISPWNYPVNLLLMPLIGAIAAGNTVTLKSSSSVPATEEVLSKIINESFTKEYVSMVSGERPVYEHLLQQRFNLIFFTGSPMMGKVVMEAASKFLTPVVLELGGKSPCIIDKGAKLEVAAKRVAWGKFLNAGQTCLAPDYLFLHQSIQHDFIELLKKEIKALFGEQAQESPYFGRIVHTTAFERLEGYLKDGELLLGGKTDKRQLYIAPTLMKLKDKEVPIMENEIFGPILPIMSFSTLAETTQYINAREKPLALYYFGKNASIIDNTYSGGAIINDTMIHAGSHHLPFGGVGNSGTGSYHGKQSFLAFSHAKSVMKTTTLFDIPLRYAPYKAFKLVKKVL